jgi:hypothetical protein
VEDHIYSIDTLFHEYEEVHALAEATRILENGNPLLFTEVDRVADTDYVRMYHPDGRFAGVYQKGATSYTIRKNFLE